MRVSQPEVGSNDVDATLNNAISELLEIDAAEVEAQRESSFTLLGGDSVKALQLTFELDAFGLSLDVDHILDPKSTIQTLSQTVKTNKIRNRPGELSDASVNSVKPQTDAQAYQWIRRADTETLIDEALAQIGCARPDVQDILPVTSQQKLLWLASRNRPNTYVAHWTFNLPSWVDVGRLRKAWQVVMEGSPALRTRFILSSDDTVYQAAVASKLCDKLWKHENAECGIRIDPDYGKPLLGYGVENSTLGRSFHLCAHHAVYDRWSMHLIFNDLRHTYSQTTCTISRPSFVPLLAPLPQQEQITLTEKWRNFLGETFLTPVPDLAPRESPASASAKLVENVTLSPSTATKGELFIAAWSWVCSKQSHASEISFGLTVWGRDIPIPGITEMAFPTLRTLPICVRVEKDVSVGDFLGQINSTLSVLRSIQQLDLEEISAINEVCRRACHYNSIVVVQSEQKPPRGSLHDFLEPNEMSFDMKLGHPLVLECVPMGNQLSISMNYHRDYISTGVAKALLSRLRQTLEVFSTGDVQLCAEIDLFSTQDDRMIRQWARPCEKRNRAKMHSTIEDHSLKEPNNIALWTTNSKLTYRHLMEDAKKLAHILRSRGATGNIGTCFERSSLAIIAQIGVSVSGCAFVPMEPSNPSARLEQIVLDSQMSLLVCSKFAISKLEGLFVPILVLDFPLLSQSEKMGREIEPQPADSGESAYIVYTSGSTGAPKGVVIQHEQISTSLTAQRRFCEANANTRTLQFSSLAFDMSIHEIYMTLSAGGTVCIPTEIERYELDDFLDRAKVNYSMLTPSVAATLPDQSLSQISNISLAGEPLRKGQIERILKAGSQPWIVYGPTETTVINLGQKASESTSRYNLGYTFGATAWVVDADDPQRLAPAGTPGELAFSGNTLSVGYYNDVEKTKKAFRTDLKWTREFPDHLLDRVYLTGDLVHYNHDGTIQFLGRLGGYTKIAGNRVDLDEIQHVLTHECDLTEASVLICQVSGQNTHRDMLLCFFAEPSPEAKKGTDCQLIEYTSYARSHATAALRTLKKYLPRYMIPSGFLQVNKIPINTSGKLAAATLRNLLTDLDVEHLLNTYGVNDSVGEDDSQRVTKGQVTQSEEDLKDAWEVVLSIAASNLNLNSHFVKLGGDSLTAMRLAATLRRSNLCLRVNDILKTPVLGEMAGKLRQQASSTGVKPMFSEEDYEELIKEAVKILEITSDSIEFLSLCSSLQIQMLVASEQSYGTFIHTDCFHLQPDLDRDEVQDVCRALIGQNELLRTRIFVDPRTGRFLQAILRGDSAFSFEVWTASVAQYLNNRDRPIAGLSGVLCRFVLLDNGVEGSVLVWEMHHCIYDGYSQALLLKRLRSLIEQRRQPHADDKMQVMDTVDSTHRNYIQFLVDADKESARKFWSDFLDGARTTSLNILKPVPAHSLTNAREEKSICLPHDRFRFTMATYLRAAFAVVISRYTASSDLTFAVTVNGRDLPVDRIEDIAGPTFATIPARAQIRPKEPVGSFLSRTQQESADCAFRQTLSVEEIGRLGAECHQACQFQTHLLIQTQDMRSEYRDLAALGYKVLDEASSMQLQIPFNLVATIRDTGIELEVIYNDVAIQSAECKLFLDQLSAILQQLIASSEDVVVEKICCLGEKNMELIMAAQPHPDTTSSQAFTIPELILPIVDAAPGNEALFSSNVSFTYQELYEGSQSFCNEIMGKLGQSGQLIGFCFEKSAYAIVAQLAILIAGNAFVPIDPNWPETRRRSILQQTRCPLIVTSPMLADKFKNFDVDVLTFPESKCGNTRTVLPEIRPSDVAYVLFTSGSTGAPKGVVVEHGSISRTLQAYTQRLNFKSSTRALLFASFTFDASIMEIWSVLAAGGTLCIANEHQRISNLTDFIATSRSTCVGLTPTAAGLLEPDKLSSLETLLFCGEQCRDSDRKRWQDCDTTLVNAYGPTEACVNAATNIHFRDTQIDDIGTSLGGGLWIVSPDNVDEILPVDCIGELMISGSILAREYLNAAELTGRKFIHPKWPTWTGLKGERVFRTGDLARLDANGHLHILGRNDDQMKINGIRVEYGEIESAVQQSSAKIKEVVASTFQNDDEVVELALYFVPSDALAHAEADRILPLGHGYPRMITAMRSAAEEALPRAFVPTIYIPISRIPQTISGKVDRKLLAYNTSLLHLSQLKIFRGYEDERSLTEARDQSTRSRTASCNGCLSDTEQDMQSMWATALASGGGSTSLNPDSHFVKVGGNSIAAIRLASIARSKDIHLPVQVIYANPKLGDMARAIEQQTPKGQRTPSEESIQAFDLLDNIDMTSPMSEATPGLSSAGGQNEGFFGALR